MQNSICKRKIRRIIASWPAPILARLAFSGVVKGQRRGYREIIQKADTDIRSVRCAGS